VVLGRRRDPLRLGELPQQGEENLGGNPRVAFNGWADGKNYRVKRDRFKTSGPQYEDAWRRATSGQRQFPGKTAVVCEIEELFQGNDREGAGQRLS